MENLEDQLFDELFKRFWLLQLNNGGLEEAAEVARYRAVARRSLEGLSRGELTRRQILNALFPAAAPAPDDAWWSTPLGRLLLAAPDGVRADDELASLTGAA